jgi:MFS superfamily sulfate permease-like transporter
MSSHGKKQGSPVFKDLLASVVVFLVALPLCMGIAIASGVPPALGLITGMIGGVVVGSLAGAPLQVSGPAAGLTVLVFEIVRVHGIAMLGPIVLAAGLLQLVAGYFRLGQWFRSVNPSVIEGMLGGIGALILVSQFHVMLDSSPRGSGISNLVAIPQALYSLVLGSGTGARLQAGFIGLLTIAVMIAWNSLKKTPLKVVPAPLVAVVVGTCAVQMMKLPIKTVSLPDSLWGAVSFPTIEALSNLWNPTVLVSIFSIALIASAETLLCASALTKLRADAKSNYDKELVAQGVGNMLCGILGAIPMTGVIVRSTANIQAGGQTRLSAILHGVWLLALVLLAPGLLKLVPMASLAAVLVFTGYKLLNPYGVVRLAQYGRSAVVIYFITLVGIVLTDLLTGVLLGVGASLLMLVHSMSGLRISKEDKGASVTLHLRGSATVFSLPSLANALESIPAEKPIRLNLHKLFYLDHACMDLIETIRTQRKDTAGELLVDAAQLKLKYLRSLSGRPAPASQAMLQEELQPQVQGVLLVR